MTSNTSCDHNYNYVILFFSLKPIGVSEWLSPTSKLSQLECVHNSLKLEQDVQLGLCVKSEENMQVIARTQCDDLRDAELRADDIVPNEMATTINYDDMMILIGMYRRVIKKQLTVNKIVFCFDFFFFLQNLACFQNNFL